MQTSTAGGLFVFLRPCQGTGDLFVHIRTDATGLAGGFGVYTPKGRIAGASRAFVYTNAILLCKNACWAMPKPHLFCIVPMQAAHLFQTLLRRRHFLRRQDLKQSPSFPAAFPASPSPLPESGGALRMNTTCGRRCAALCGRQYDAALRRPDLLHQFEHQLLAVPFLCVCQTTLI